MGVDVTPWHGGVVSISMACCALKLDNRRHRGKTMRGIGALAWFSGVAGMALVAGKQANNALWYGRISGARNDNDA